MTDEQRPKVLAAIPLYKTVDALAVPHLFRTLFEAAQQGILTQWEFLTNIFIARARNRCVAKALKMYDSGELTHLFFMDDDTVCPPGTIGRLLSHNLPIVGGVYFDVMLTPMAWHYDPFRFVEDVPDSGLLRVGGMGCGCVLIDCRVLAAIERQCGVAFLDEYRQRPLEATWTGEDVYFFEQVRKLEIPVHLDCEVKCGHIKPTVITRDHYLMAQAAKAAQKAAEAAPHVP